MGGGRNAVTSLSSKRPSAFALVVNVICPVGLAFHAQNNIFKCAILELVGLGLDEHLVDVPRLELVDHRGLHVDLVGFGVLLDGLGLRFF